MIRDTRAAFRRRKAQTDRSIDAAVAEVAAERDARYRAAREALRAAEESRVRFTAADLAKAKYVRDRTGWHEVIRVNRQSVTVATGHSWTARIPVGRVLEFKEATA